MVQTLALVVALAGQGPVPVRLEAFARVEHPPIDEMSGIVKSRRYPGVFWVHNDSGDLPRLFAIDLQGKVVTPSWKSPTNETPFEGLRVQQAENSDWEDITSDGDYLYIGDVGNNGNARRDLGVYVLPEPNPLQADKSRALTWLPVAYPDQKEFPPQGDKPFDCEAIFWLRGKLFFLTKHRSPQGLPVGAANLYRMDTRHTDRMNTLTKVDGRADLGGWVTGADVSPDGKTLAVLAHAPLSSVWLFNTDVRGDKLLSGGEARRFAFVGAAQCEAICWDGNGSLIVTNEQRSLYRLDLSKFGPVPQRASIK